MQNTTDRRNGFIWGLLLIMAGVIFLLQNMGFFVNIGAWLAMVLFGTGGFVFLYVFLTDFKGRWWAAIPGSTLLGLAATIFFESYGPRFLNGLGGPAFLASIGFGFVLVFLADIRKWWAIIPAGVMSTLAVVAGVDELHIRGMDTGGIFFLGLGCTFLLLFLLTGQREKRQNWALIPAAVLLIMGVLIGTPWIGYMDNLWPLALIAVGAFWVLRNLRGHSRDGQTNDRINEEVTQSDSTDQALEDR
ncbi:MAG TPA: hypothetical protein P5121_16070 [Caldilineaceae bacterium]|nr:hypothetical protein [Caldilineaceae bacterium]